MRSGESGEEVIERILVGQVDRRQPEIPPRRKPACSATVPSLHPLRRFGAAAEESVRLASASPPGRELTLDQSNVILAVMFRQRHPHPISLAGVVAAILLLLAAQAADFYHDNFVRHEVCSDHNELVDAGPGLAIRSSQNTGTEVGAGPEHSQQGHSHCLFHGASASRRSPLREYHFVLAENNSSEIVVSNTARYRGPPQVSLILQAPKNSPPA